MVTANPLFLRDTEVDRSLELILLAERELAGQAMPLARRHALSAADVRLMHLVAKRPGATTADLARLLGVTKQTVSRQVAALTAGGHLERRPSTADARKLSLHLTPVGQARIDEVGELQRRRLRLAFKRAGAEAVEGFRRVLTALTEDGVRRPGRQEAA
jgi:DNA-binding MarR family transcriptional regulator